MKKSNSNKNMHKVICKHILILIGIAVIMGLFFLIKNFI